MRVPERQGRRDAERRRGAVGVRGGSGRRKIGRALVAGGKGGVRLAVEEGVIVAGPGLVQMGRVRVGVMGVRMVPRGVAEGVDRGEGRGQRPEMRLGRTGGGEGRCAVRVGERQARGTVRRGRVQRGTRRGHDGGDGRPGRQGERVEEGRRGERCLVRGVRVWAGGEGVGGAGEVGGVREVAAGAHGALSSSSPPSATLSLNWSRGLL